MKGEDHLPGPVALRDAPDGAVAILHGEGKVPFLRGAAHALVFALGYPPFRDHTLGSAANAGIEGFHQNTLSEGSLAQFNVSGGNTPQCSRTHRGNHVRIFRHALGSRLPLVEKRSDNEVLHKALGFVRSLFIYLNPSILRAWRRFYAEILSPGDRVIDVGAHVGTRSRAMRAVGATVVAMEPQRPFSTFLRWTLPKDIVVLDAAAGPAESTARLAVSSRHPTVSSLRTDFVDGAASASGFEQVRWNDSQQVRVVTLDSVIRQYGTPRYIKIDVEGFEEEVLRGLTTPVELISVEFLPGFPQLSLGVMARLMQLGPYQFNPVVGESAHFAWPEWRDSKATASWLQSLPVASSSGDLFARLQPS